MKTKKLTTFIIIIIFVNIFTMQLWGQDMGKTWDEINNKTYIFDNNFSKFMVSFYEDELKNKKCLYQKFESINNKYVFDTSEFGTIIYDKILLKKNSINCENENNGSESFLLQKNKLWQFLNPTKTISKEPLNKIIVGNKKGKINPETFKSKYFKIENINKYPTLADEEKNKKADKEEVLEVVVSFKKYTPFTSQDQMEDGGLLFSHALEYFVESPKEFYGKKLEVFTDEEISEKNILRKENTKIKFKIQRKYLVKTYQNKDGTTNTYEAYLGEIYKYGDIKETAGMKEVYLTHETFDKIAKYAKSNGSSIGLGDGHFAFINNYEIRYYEKINRNNKEFSALLLQNEKTKQKLFIYKFYEKLKWAYECMVEKVISDSLSEPQEHGFPNDFFDANEWFKEILGEIEKKEKYLTVENFNVIRTFILQTGKYPFNYPLSSIEKKQFYRLKFDDIYLYTSKDENNIIITSKNYKISLIRNLDEKKLFFDIPLPIAYPKEYHQEHKAKLNIWFKEILKEVKSRDEY